MSAPANGDIPGLAIPASGGVAAGREALASEIDFPAVSAATIIVAEDHPMFRAALVLTLRRLMPDALLMEVATHGELEKALARSGEVKMVLLDLRMPGAHGLSSLVFLRGYNLAATRRSRAVEMNDSVIEQRIIAEKFRYMQER